MHALRLGVSSVLKSAKPPRKNLTGKQHKTIRSLRRDKDIIILPADKGNATVVMNRSDYTAKMEDLLEDPAYKKMKCNPTTRVETRISSALKELEQKGYLSNKQPLSLSPSFSEMLCGIGLPLHVPLPHALWMMPHGWVCCVMACV